MGLRFLQLLITTAAAYAAFIGFDTANEPLIIGALVAIAVGSLVVGLIRRAKERERRDAGLPRSASATFLVAVAFLLLEWVGYAGAGAVVWASDTCTTQFGSHNANITFTGFFSKAGCQSAENTSQNHVMGVIGTINEDILSKLPGVGNIASALGSPELHDGAPVGNTVCTGWPRQARWIIVTVRDQGTFDIFGKAMCKNLNGQGLLTYPWG